MSRILFFDLETTGLPCTKKGNKYNRYYHPSELNNYDSSRMVSIAWQIYDIDTHNKLSEQNHIVYPDNFISSSRALEVHGITTEIAKEQGKNAKDIFELFKKDLKENLNIISGFNVQFDYNVFLSECYRYGEVELINSFNKIPVICTQQIASKKLENEKYCRYKFYPRLEEVYRFIFKDNKFNTSHDALDDTQRCADIYFKLKDYNKH